MGAARGGAGTEAARMGDMLIFSLNGVGPILLLMAVGLLLQRCGVIDRTAAGKINRMAFVALIPCRLFSQVYSSDLGAVADMKLLGICLLGSAAVLALLCAIVPRLIGPGPALGEFIQGVFRGNAAILGLPLITNLYGDAASTVIALPLAVMVIFYNVTSPVVLAVYSGGSRPKLKDVIRKVATNPFLIGTVLGVIVNLSGLKLPVFIEKTVDNLGTAGSTVALVALGAMIDARSFRTNGKLALTASALRLLAIAPLMLLLGSLLGLRNEQLAAVVCFFATPTAVGGYVLAKNVDGDGRLAGQILIVTTLMSTVTMFLTLAALKGLGVM